MTEIDVAAATLLAEKVRDKAQLVVNCLYDLAREEPSERAKVVAADRAVRLLHEVAYDAVMVGGLFDTTITVEWGDSEELSDTIYGT